MMAVPRGPDAPRPAVTPAPVEARSDEWQARVARVLVAVPHRLRRPLAWLAGRRVSRLLAHTAAALVRVQIFDRSMTLAAQAFTSIFPVVILLGALVGPGESTRLADFARLPEASRSVLADALGHNGINAFGVVGSLAVLASSTGLARALARAYAAVWTVGRAPAGPRASWRWLATVLTIAAYVVGTHLLGRVVDKSPAPLLVSAVVLLLADCGVAIVVPWLLLGGTVPERLLVAGGVIFGLIMLAVRPVGSVYLPRALQTSAERYGTIGVAFAYIGWLYVMAFCLLLAAILGQVVAQDEGAFGRLVRGRDR